MKLEESGDGKSHRKSLELPNAWARNATALFHACEITDRDMPDRVLVEIPPAAYDYEKGNPDDNWLYHAFKGFQRLQMLLDQEGKSCEHFVTVGTGPGLDALGAAYIFDPHSLTITDYNRSLLTTAEENVFANLPRARIAEFASFGGNLLSEANEGRDAYADVVYGNLPNLPADKVNLRDMTSASYVERALLEGCPEKFDRHLLALQYHFLQQSHVALKPHGSAVMALGGRVPYEVVAEMFDECGFDLQVLHIGLKRQTQPAIVQDYARAEIENQVPFVFYALDEVPGSEAPREGVDFVAAKVQERLRPFELEANEAVKYLKLLVGRQIGHLVWILRGVKR